MNLRGRFDEQWPQLKAKLLPLVTCQREKASQKRKLQGIPDEPFLAPEAGLEAFLRAELAFAVQQYEVERWAEEQGDAMTLDEIAGPIDAVLDALRNPANDGAVYQALGGGDVVSGIDVFKGIRRRDALIGYLALLRSSAAHHQPRKWPNHRPAGVMLRRFVGCLANTWIGATGWTFGSEWLDGDPVTPAAQFAHAVVQAVHPAQTPRLQTTMRWVVNARRRGKLPGFFNDRAREDAI